MVVHFKVQTRRKRNGKIEQSKCATICVDTVASLFSSALELDPFSAPPATLNFQNGSKTGSRVVIITVIIYLQLPVETTGVELVFVLVDFPNPSNTLASGELGAKCKRSEERSETQEWVWNDKIKRRVN